GFCGARDDGPAKVRRVRAGGSQPKDVTTGPLNSGFPTFSPDGRQIAYRVWGNYDRPSDFGIRVMTLGDGSVKTLTTELDNFPAWSPRGDLISFTRRSHDEDYDYDIYTMRPDGTNVKRLTDAAGNDSQQPWAPGRQDNLWEGGRHRVKE